ncbi:hypothetical protein LOTGIDRAFT_156597 [Lottia gigantea]|uniref:Uncharacterized protein n=1 Tax=Lottia gigantea TaxID=225164 RepID=V4B136_LOTGI|nr:hypothetical protein LOTGIDRAFT_156597 [Lottia gigantea]ESP03993.1 hypothetical protein LOTGIDRAFT_156597 [Lottia gigantea]
MAAVNTNGPLPPPTRVNKNFLVGKPNPKWGENLPQDFFERLKLFEEESRLRKQELNEKTLEEIKHNLEQKLAGQHKLSKREEQMYDALKDVSLPALFMPYKTGNVYNPRAHQYFHPTGSQDMRLTQPPSVFQLPPLKAGDWVTLLAMVTEKHENLTKHKTILWNITHFVNKKMSVLNLFDLSRNFQRPKESWLMDKYIQQQQPLEYPGLIASSDRTASGFKSSSGPQLPLDSKCSNSLTDRQQQPDTSRHDQQVQA